MSATLSKLLEDPFGPYPDTYLLNPQWPRQGHDPRPTLTSVQMRCKGVDIGLDETELLLPPPSTARHVAHPVVVFGVLEIEKLSWLSETGRKWLEYDLQIRDDAKSINKKTSNLTLEEVYGDGINSGSTISVWLKFEKAVSAAYMTMLDDPDSLVLTSLETTTNNHHRLFRVASLDVRTMELSRGFIERYTIRRLCQQLIDGSDTPITGRNIEWLVDRYFAQVIPLDKYIRDIYNPNAAGIITNSRGSQKLKKPRHPRPKHKAEIRNIFARHAEWILADHIVATRSVDARYLDIVYWYKFVKQVKRVNNWKKFRSRESVDERDVARSLTKFGGDQEEWYKRLCNALKEPYHWIQKRQLERQVRETTSRFTPDKIVAPPKRTSPPPVGRLLPPMAAEQLPGRPRNEPPVYNNYDEDFDYTTTPPASDSDSSELDNQHRDLSSKVPWFCYVPPKLKVYEHIWRCPGCKYEIDLLNPREDDIEEIPKELADVLRFRDWQRVTEPEVSRAFGHLVTNHYNGHLQKLGIEHVRKNGKTHVKKWQDPEPMRRRSRRLNEPPAAAR